MPFRPASAPTSHSSGLARRRTGLAGTGNRVQFAGPESFSAQCEKRLPKDPLPDSDDDRENPDWTVTPSPCIAGTLSTPSKNAEVKWWHVPDTRIEDLVHQIGEHISSPDPSGNLTPAPISTSASSPPCHPSRSPPTFAASSTCRALAGSGRPKLRSTLHKAGFFDGCQSDFSATSSSLPHSYGSSETGRLDFSGGSASWASSPQKPKFKSVSSAKNTLLDSRPPPLGVCHKRPSTAPEMTQCRLDNSSGAASLEQQRPWSSSSDTRARIPRHAKKAGGNSKIASSTLKETNVSEKDLIEVELAFYNGTERILVLIHSDALMGPNPVDEEMFDKASLKGMIAKLTGISISDQRLLCRGFDVSHDHKSLRKLGVSHGSTVMVYDKKDWQKSDVVLACTAKLLQKQQSAQQQAMRRASITKAKNGASPKILPKWGWGTPPSAAYDRKGWHATGQDMTLRFEDHFSWRDPEATPSLSGIRSSLTFTQPIEYML